MKYQQLAEQYPNWHYLGFKRSMVDWILRALDRGNIHYHSVLDLYGGSGIMTYCLLEHQKSVWYNDLLTSNTLMVEGLLQATSKDIITKDNISWLFSHTPSKMYHHAEQHLQAYFSDDECRTIDRLLSNLVELRDTDKIQYQLLLYIISQALILKQGAGTYHKNTMNRRRKDHDPTSTWNQPVIKLMESVPLISIVI